MNKLLLLMVLMVSVIAPGLQGAAAVNQDDRLTKFFWAASIGGEEAIEFLHFCLKNKLVDVDYQGPNGATALHCAALNKRYDVAECLAHYNANSFILDKHGKSPIDFANDFKDARMMEILLVTPVEEYGQGSVRPAPARRAVANRQINSVQPARRAAAPVIAAPVGTDFKRVRREYRPEVFSEGAATGKNVEDLQDWAFLNVSKMSVAEKNAQQPIHEAETREAQDRFKAIYRELNAKPALLIEQGRMIGAQLVELLQRSLQQAETELQEAQEKNDILLIRLAEENLKDVKRQLAD